jgi:sugar lactone lactonase YvrE
MTNNLSKRLLPICSIAFVSSFSLAQTPAEKLNPYNTLPNLYNSQGLWSTLPDNRTWGSTAGVDIDPDGKHLWAIDRCGSNSCVGSNLNPILKITPKGEVVKEIGAGLFLFPHGLHVDNDGNIWVTDAQGPNGEDARRNGKGHVVIKLNPEGDVLLTLGKPGVAGDGSDEILNTPCDVVTAPNGDIFVGDGHSGQSRDATPDTVARIVKFDKNGNLIKIIGKWGSGRGEFKTPHAIDIDSQGRIIVGDRGNNRIQILDQDGNFIDEFDTFGRPSGIYVTADDTLFVADSESQFRGSKQHPGWRHGIRAGKLSDKEPNVFIRGIVDKYPGGSNPEGVAVDAAGNVYGAVVSGGGAMVRSYKPAE